MSPSSYVIDEPPQLAQLTLRRNAVAPGTTQSKPAPIALRSHIFLCMLAYYVEWHMREAWRELSAPA